LRRSNLPHGSQPDVDERHRDRLQLRLPPPREVRRRPPQEVLRIAVAHAACREVGQRGARSRDAPTLVAPLLCLGNFATLTIEEDDEKFLIVQDPCGSCSSQDDHNRGEPPWHLALVRERHPITFGRGDVSAAALTLRSCTPSCRSSGSARRGRHPLPEGGWRAMSHPTRTRSESTTATGRASA